MKKSILLYCQKCVRKINKNGIKSVSRLSHQLNIPDIKRVSRVPQTINNNGINNFTRVSQQLHTPYIKRVSTLKQQLLMILKYSAECQNKEITVSLTVSGQTVTTIK
jgi:hypothetical protein